MVVFTFKIYLTTVERQGLEVLNVSNLVGSVPVSKKIRINRRFIVNSDLWRLSKKLLL